MPVSTINHALREGGYPTISDNQNVNATPSPPFPEPAPELPPVGTRSGLKTGARPPHLTQRTFGAVEHEAPSIRRTKRALSDTSADSARNTLGVLNGPTSHSVEADKTLQADLISTMGSVTDSLVTVPERSLIAQPFEIYKRVVNQPEVLAWLRGKGFSLDSVIIGKHSVSGFVTRNGVVSRQTYSLHNTSGWWQVSPRVMSALEALDPTHRGVPYVAAGSQQLSRDVASSFYDVHPPATHEQAKSLVRSLEAGWPALSTAQTGNRELRLEWAKRGIDEMDDRENLADALERAVQGLAEEASLSSQDTVFEVSRTHPLKNDYAAREQLNALVALPEMRDVLATLGEHLPSQPVRISEGRLQVMEPVASLWLDVPVGERWSQTLKDALAAVVGASEQSGGALYSEQRYDLRQVAKSMNLGELDTVSRAKAAIEWLRTGFAPPAPGGNYAQLLPQAWAPGTLSSSDKQKLVALATDNKYGANTLGTVWGRRIVTQIDPQQLAAKADSCWDQLLSTPEAQEWGRELARELRWHSGTPNGQISDEGLRHLLTSAVMLSVDPDAPAKPGTAAGYDFYQPANMGREMGAVRKDFEQHLIEKKGVSPRAATLVAHLFLAQAAPEFLVKPDQQQSTQIPEQLRVSEQKIRVGSPAWMTLTQGAALADVWGGAGASRGMSVKELSALTTLKPVLPQQQALTTALGARVVLNVGVMTGTVPRRSDDKYSPEDYQKASDAIAHRSALLEKTIGTLGTAPPTRISLAIKALKAAFPELTDSEIETLTLRKPATKFSKEGFALNAKRPTLVEAYATGDLHQSWFGFNHPRISQSEFETRKKILPRIADEVTGAVDAYLSAVKAAMPALMKMSFANLPLDVRQALEWGTVDIFRLRQETGETQPQDAAKGNKVAENRGWHGVLLRSLYEGKTRYLEFFPASGLIVDRTESLSGEKLDLNGGVVEEERVPLWKSGTQKNRYLRGTLQPFDFNAFLTGEATRANTPSKIIISQVGSSLAGAASKGQGDNAGDWVPNTFGSDKSQAIVDAILSGNYIGNYSGHRKALLDHANAVLPSEDTNRGYIDRLMTKENGRAMVSMISFIGPLVDIFEGNVKDGVKGLLIDFISFAGTGGLQATYKAWRAIKLASRLNRQAFSIKAVKEGTSLLRGIFNPAEGFVDLASQPGKFWKFFARTRRGIPTKVGMGVFVPADVFEKARFVDSAAPSVAEILKMAGPKPSHTVQGTINQIVVQAVRARGEWYALNPRTGTPTGAPLQGFVPATA